MRNTPRSIQSFAGTALAFSTALCLFLAMAGCKTSKPSIAGSGTVTTSAAPAGTQDLPVENTTAEQQLLAASADIGARSDQLQKLLQAAQAELAKKNETINASIAAKTAAEQAQLAENNRQALAAYQQNAGALQNQVAAANIKIQTLTDLVRKEQNLPAQAQFDPRRQAWTVPAK